MKEDALDCTTWRTLVGSGRGHVVRMKRSRIFLSAQHNLYKMFRPARLIFRFILKRNTIQFSHSVCSFLLVLLFHPFIVFLTFLLFPLFFISGFIFKFLLLHFLFPLFISTSCYFVLFLHHLSDCASSGGKCRLLIAEERLPTQEIQCGICDRPNGDEARLSVCHLLFHQ